jgi:hypothetical protein
MRTLGPAEYCCQLLDNHGRIVWRSKFCAATDDKALTMARSFLRPRTDSACIFELWRDANYIGCEHDALAFELGAV